jgi:YD repeat-containing protein
MVVSSLLPAAANPPTGGDRVIAGDPVDLFTGLNVREHDDIVVGGEPRIELHRSFGSRWSRSRAFGIGTSHSFDVFLAAESEEAKAEKKRLDLMLPNGGRVPFVRTSLGTGRTGAVLVHTGTPGAFHGSRLSWNGAAWDLELLDGSRFSFPPCEGAVVRPEQCALSGYRDGQGRSLTFDRDSNGNLRRVSAGWLRKINFRYDSAHRIVRADTGWGCR